MAFGLIGLVGVIGSGAAHALIFASPDMEPAEAVPPDFPYWEHVTQRRYQGPSVLYLGGGWALTARHVGMGEVFLEGRIFAPIAGSQRTLLNLDGSPADLMVFEIDRSEGDPGLPLLPLARRPVERGDQVLLIGFGRGRARVVEWDADGTSQFGFQWDAVGRKRWGTNRIDLVGERVNQGAWSTITIGFGFDPPLGARTTRYEAAAATGDSGGAVFVQRDGTWELAGVDDLGHRYDEAAPTPRRPTAIGPTRRTSRPTAPRSCAGRVRPARTSRTTMGTKRSIFRTTRAAATSRTTTSGIARMRPGRVLTGIAIWGSRSAGPWHSSFGSVSGAEHAELDQRLDGGLNALRGLRDDLEEPCERHTRPGQLRARPPRPSRERAACAARSVASMAKVLSASSTTKSSSASDSSRPAKGSCQASPSSASAVSPSSAASRSRSSS
ncbi:MAG: hypothetical protein R3E53_11995 [Myxococcota bacterium]